MLFYICRVYRKSKIPDKPFSHGIMAFEGSDQPFTAGFVTFDRSNQPFQHGSKTYEWSNRAFLSGFVTFEKPIIRASIHMDGAIADVNLMVDTEFNNSLLLYAGENNPVHARKSAHPKDRSRVQWVCGFQSGLYSVLLFPRP